MVAGATGDLGTRIIKSLLKKNASVVALVRKGTDPEKLDQLTKPGIGIIQADYTDVQELAKACAGVSCVVSALQGLRDVIVDAQTSLLNAAVSAGVPRFIPSDFSTDFTKLVPGDNRNFDLRREFQKILEQAPISGTSIFNGAFANILTYNIPVLDFKNKTVGYWGENPDWKLDFTTMDDTASFTAEAAIDATTPRFLRIASFQISPNDLVRLTGEVLGTEFTLKNMGTVEAFAAYNRQQRAAHPEGENEIYPKWQSAQYLQSMFTTQHESLDNDRYPELTWSTAKEVLSTIR
jgi:hypothetical protein